MKSSDIIAHHAPRVAVFALVLLTDIFLATSFMLEGEVVDPSRVIGQVITGIGFLGSGAWFAALRSTKSYTSHAYPDETV